MRRRRSGASGRSDRVQYPTVDVERRRFDRFERLRLYPGRV